MQTSSLNISTPIQDGSDEIIYYNHLGKELLATEPERAHSYFSQALATSIDIQNYELIADGHFLSAQAFIELGQTQDAIIQYITALSVAETHQLPVSKILNGLYEAYKLTGDFENALKYYELYHQSIRNIDQENKWGQDSRIFLRHLVHDIKEPVRVVSSYHHILTKGLREAKINKYDEYLNYIEAATKRINSLISGFGTYVNIDTGTEQRSELSLDEVIHIAKYNAKKMLSDSNTQIIHGELSKAYGNFKQITLLFEYLIDNAVRYNKSDSPSIRINTQQMGDYCRVSVADNGIGIQKEELKKLLDITQAPKKHAKNPNACGMGLIICKKIIQKHEGNIWIESVPEKGTTVYFTIPINGS